MSITYQILALVGLLAAPMWARGWVRVASPVAEVVTDAGEGAARRALDRLETVAAVLGGVADGGVAGETQQLRLFLFETEKEFRGYSTQAADDGFFQSGYDRDFIVTHAGVGISRVVAHEYVHFLLNHSLAAAGRPRLPAWLDEGMAEFYSNLVVSRGAVRIGEPIESHRALLERTIKSGSLLTAAQLEQGPDLSGDGREAGEPLASIYYAESWALVHMLNLAPAYRDRFPGYIASLEEPRDPAETFETVFGQSVFGQPLDRAIAALPGYLREMRGVRVSTSDSGRGSADPVAKPEPVSELAALLMRGELTLRTGRVDTARSVYAKVERRHRDEPDAVSGLAAFALAEGRDEDARTLLRRALALNDRDAASWFTLAMVEQNAGAEDRQVEEMLRRVVELNPAFGEAHLILGVRATDEERLPEAIQHLQEAVKRMPRRSYAWHALAYALDKDGRLTEAADAAARAVRTAVNRDQLRMAETLLESLRVRARN